MPDLDLNFLWHGCHWAGISQIRWPPEKDVLSLRAEISTLVTHDPLSTTIVLWKPRNSICAENYDPTALQDLPSVATCLNPLRNISHYFTPPLCGLELHIIVELRSLAISGPAIESIERKSKRSRPSLPSLQKLEDGYLDEPLPEDKKIPISPQNFQALVTPDCDANTLGKLFRLATDALPLDHTCVTFCSAIMANPPPINTSELGMIYFWDANVRTVVERLVTGGQTIRESNQKTGNRSRPAYGFCLRGFCPLRGEEKSNATDGDPERELVTKLVWSFDPAEYIFGYFVRYTSFTICAILKPQLEAGSLPRVQRLGNADLANRKGRVVNLIRLLRLCDLLPLISDMSPRDDAEFITIIRQDKSLRLDPLQIQKTYTINSKERLEHLQRVYDALTAKNVRNVDRVKYISFSTGTAVLEPRGTRERPSTTQELYNLLKCVLEALVDMHAEPPIFHRDIRWENILQNPDDHTKYFLIDFDDATGLPTKAAASLNPENHCETVFRDGHGPEVDLWAVGQLMESAYSAPLSISALGRHLMKREISTAKAALQRLLDTEVDCHPPTTRSILP